LVPNSKGKKRPPTTCLEGDLLIVNFGRTCPRKGVEGGGGGVVCDIVPGEGGGAFSREGRGGGKRRPAKIIRKKNTETHRVHRFNTNPISG